MHIYWQGISCVKIQIGDSVFIFNPFDDSVGLTMPKLRADVVISTNLNDAQSNNFNRLQGEPFVIGTPGEFEVRGMHIRGVELNQQDVFFLLKAEGMTLAHLGTASTVLTDEQLEILEGVDVLFLPLTSQEGISAAKIVALLEPRVVIPIMYKTAKEKINLSTLDTFVKEMGLKQTDPIEKIILKRKDLPQEETQVHILSVA